MGQALANVATPTDEDALVGFFQWLQLAHHRANMVGGGDEENLVAVFDHRIPLRHDRPVFPENGGDPCFDFGHMAAQVRQFVANQWAAFRRPNGDQLNKPLGKLQYLQRAGVFDQSCDVLGDQVLRADQNIDGETPQAVQILFLISLVEQFWFCQVGVGPDPADGCRGFVEQLGDLAGHHVDLVTVGHGDDHVTIFSARLAQNRGKGGHALDSPNVQSILKLPQAGTVTVDHGDVVGFVGEVFCQGPAHLAGTENQDFHGSGFSSTA